jgi:response regulator RpfG family c-di-GMP phosphodiesterase
MRPQNSAHPFDTGICPITGTNIITATEWQIHEGPYRCKFGLVDNQIILSQPSGRSSLENGQSFFKTLHKITAKYLAPGQKYVLIDDYRYHISATKKARDNWIRETGADPDLAGIIFLNVSPFFKLSIKTGKLLKLNKFAIEIAVDYQQALEYAQKILNKNIRHTDKHNGFNNEISNEINNENIKTPMVTSNEEWSYVTPNFECRIELINNYVLHTIFTGKPKILDIDPVVQLHRKVIKYIGMYNPNYEHCNIHDFSRLPPLPLNLVYQYIKAMKEFAKELPANHVVLIGGVLTSIFCELGNRFLPYSISRAKTRNEAIAHIERHRFLLPQAVQNVDETHRDVYDILEILSNIDWEIPGPIPIKSVPVDEPHYEFFESLSVIKSDLNILLEERDIEEKNLEKERKLQKELLVELENALELSEAQRRTTEAATIINQNLNEEILGTQKEILLTLADVIETRSSDSPDHVLRVSNYAYSLGLFMGLTNEEATVLKYASALHDVGKIGIPEDILRNEDHLMANNLKLLRTHPQLGYDILKNSKSTILEMAALIAYQHHEFWDGNGYPNHLKAEEIHIYSRITALADVFDRLTVPKFKQPPQKFETAIHYIKSLSGIRFDPTIVEIFLKNSDSFKP